MKDMSHSIMLKTVMRRLYQRNYFYRLRKNFIAGIIFTQEQIKTKELAAAEKPPTGGPDPLLAASVAYELKMKAKALTTLKAQFEAHKATGEPKLAPEYDDSKIDGLPWHRGYGDIFRDEQVKQKGEVATRLYDACQSQADDDNTKALRQVVTNMKFIIDGDKPTQAQIFKHLG